MLINHTNHNSKDWSQKQRSEAQKKYGTILDVPFPEIDPMCDSRQLDQIVQKQKEQIVRCHPDAVLCQGEFVYTYRLTNALKESGIEVLAACSRRVVTESVQQDGNTRKESIFEFVQFRAY